MNKLKTLILAVVFVAAAHAQTGTSTTQAALLSSFADGQAAGSITPAYMRNFVASIVPATKTEGYFYRFGAGGAPGISTNLFANATSVGIGPVNTSPTGTLHVYDPTATTGATTLIIRTGAGQGSAYQLAIYATDGSTPYHYWSGADYKFLGSISDIGNKTGMLTSVGFRLANDRKVTWSSDTAQYGTSDIGLSRAFAGVLEVNNGTALSLRDLNVRTLSGGWTAGTEGGCNTYTDLVVDGTLNTKVTSASYNFVAADVGSWLDITAGGAWTGGRYVIVSVAANAATLASSPAAVNSTTGTFITGRGKIVNVEGGAGVADTLRFCGKGADNAMAWRALY